MTDEQNVEKDERWHDVKSGLVAELKICCPECMGECVIEFDSQELDGATEVRMPCDGCGLTLSAYLAATVQQQGQLSLPSATPPLVPYPNGHTHPAFVGCSEAMPRCPMLSLPSAEQNGDDRG